MNRFLYSFLLLLSISSVMNAQRKSDLIKENKLLKSQLDSVTTVVVDAKKNEKRSVAKAEYSASQVSELQNANAALLKNLNTFATISNKNSDNVNRAMASLHEKESQLKFIRNGVATNDSTALVVLTQMKKILGENAQISVNKGEVVISARLESLFKGGNSSTIISNSEAFIGKIASILELNPKMNISIESLSMTGELSLALKQARALGIVLQEKFSVNSSRINAIGKDGNLKEGVLLRIHPDYNQFYYKVREHMKAVK